MVLRNLKFALILLCLLGFTVACKADVIDLTQLKNDLADKKIIKAKIFFLPYDTESVVSITPNVLEKLPNTTIVSAKMVGEMRDSLLKAIENTKATATAEQGDLRWAAIFYDDKGNPLHSVYLDRRYVNVNSNRGLIDNRQVSVNNALIGWFESHFLPKAKS